MSRAPPGSAEFGFASPPAAGPHPSTDASSEPGSAWDGIRYLLQHPMLGGLVMCTLVLCVFAWPTLTLFPGYTRERLGLAEESYSFLVSALGGGALVAALTTATFGSVGRRGAFPALAALTFLHAAHDVLEHDNGVVDNQPDGGGHAPQRHHVETHAERQGHGLL